MNPNPDDSDKVQKLLALKRHEQPPPRFFNDFSDSVLSRLDLPVPSRPDHWWQRLGVDFDLQPPLVCALGIVVCGLLLVGVIASLDHKEPSVLIAKPSNDKAQILTPPGLAAAAPAVMIGTATKPEEMTRSTEPVVSSAGSPFNQYTMRAQAAGAVLPPGKD